MPYDEALAERVRGRLAGTREVTEQKMFGGICFMHRGHMCVGLADRDLIVRVGPEAYDAALKLKHAREMDFTGRPLKGMVYVDAAGIRSARALGAWVDRGLAFTGSLPRKSKAKAKKKPGGTKKAAVKKRGGRA